MKARCTPEGSEGGVEGHWPAQALDPCIQISLPTRMKCTHLTPPLPFSPSLVPTVPPGNVHAEATNSTTIRFTWNAPSPQFINGINQGYKVPRTCPCPRKVPKGGRRLARAER